MKRPRAFAATLGVLILEGCNLAPVYETPKVPVPSAYKETGAWQVARPADTLPRGAWWTMYDNSLLNDLETQVEAENPSLASAAAAYDRARSLADQAKAGLYPSIGMNGYLTTDKQSGRRPMRGTERPTYYGANAVGASASYEIDLWGRVHNVVRAGEAQAQAGAADLETVRLTLHAELADDYVALRGLDEESKLLTDTVGAYTEAYRLTHNLYLGKIASRIDVTRAETQLHDAQAQVSDISARRALLEHAIATLIGRPPAALTIPPAAMHILVPHVPIGLPSTLLERRPDIAAAERRVAAANARIGVAKAAFYPDISLGGNAGFQSTNIEVVTLPNDYWSIGPQLSLPLFEGGRLRAQLREAQAAFDQAGAEYRSTVLGAFQEIDDNLALLHWLDNEEQHEEQAAAAAHQTLDMSMGLYRNGAASYLDVVTAQTALLIAQRATLALQTRRLQASVGLIRALGGGWSRTDPGVPRTASN